MNDLPVMLRVAGRLCVVVGGGCVAARRAAALQQCGARVRLIAPEVSEAVVREGIEVVIRPYQTGDLRGAFLVVIATDDRPVNQAISDDARGQGVLVNRADESDEGDFTVSAHSRHGRVTVAVSTGGVSASAAAAIRSELADALDPDWPRLLDLMAPFRETIRSHFTDAEERRAKLVQLADAGMMQALKTGGEALAKARAENLLTQATPAPR
jgi:siroheme synthase-like protein